MKKQTIYKKRRQTLGQRYSNTLFIIPSGDLARRSHSVYYRFKVPSDFFYLTGLSIPESVLIIYQEKSFLLQNLPSSEAQIFGENLFNIHLANDSLKNDFHIDSLQNLESLLKSYVTNADRLALPIGRVTMIDQLALQLISYSQTTRKRPRSTPIQLSDSHAFIGLLRLIKDQAEILQLEQACQKSSSAHEQLMKMQWIGASEQQVAQHIEKLFLEMQMPWTAYETIVGSGPRTTFLHSNPSAKIIDRTDLILVDAGAEKNGYCADITRVFPAAKRFSVLQKEMYEVVLQTQKEVIKNIQPGKNLNDLHQLTLSLINELLQKNGHPLQTRNQLELFMPHSTSHWLGLDVHDPSPYFNDDGRPIQLKAGMCFTVEPGLYFNQTEGPFKNYLGLGIRIEDDVLVTEQGSCVLTSAPKETEEIETLRPDVC